MFWMLSNYFIPKTVYGGRNSTTAKVVSRSQCLFPNLNCLGVEGHPTTKNLLQYPWVDNWLKLADGDFSTSGPVKSCEVLPEVCLSVRGNNRP